MIYVTGDLHGWGMTEKLEPYVSPELYELDREDYVIVLGDFCMPWPGMPNNGRAMRWLESRPWTTLFIDGNHDHFPELAKLEPEAFCGGRAARLRRYPHLVHLLRGEVYTIGGVRIFCMGGAESVIDRKYRTEGVDWWPEELPSDAEYANAEANLAACGWKVDYVLTHCASSRMEPAALWPSSRFAPPMGNRLTRWLDTLEDKLEFRHWYFGHYHKTFGIDEKHSLLLDAVLPLGAVPDVMLEADWRAFNELLG